MAQRQISIYELMQKEEEIELPEVRDDEKAFRIPQDVWETRCQHCVHKVGKENIPVPMWMAYKHKYENVIPCRIIGICHPNDMPGECMSFAPKIDTWGICATCKHQGGIFGGDDFCRKKDHAERHRVYYGTDYGGDERKKEYWGTFRLSTCDDYEPDEYAKERRQP